MPTDTPKIEDARLPDLIEPSELAELLTSKELVLLDTRDVSQYKRLHIPGAISCEDIFYYLCLPENGGLTGLQNFFSEMFSEAGIRPTSRVVVYEDAMDNGYGRSCRGWLLFNYLGHPNVQVLHGGLRAWLSNNLPVSQEAATPTPSTFLPRVTSGYIESKDDVVKVLQDRNVTLVDCRDYAEWLGANSSPYGYDYCPRKGRIPGSVWLEWYRLMEHRDGAAWFRSPAEIREICEKSGIPIDKRVIVYCFKGARSSAVVLALRRAGYPAITNYLPSWNEWSRDFDLPADDSYPEVTPQ